MRWKQGVEWSAQTYLSLTPATHAVLVGPTGVLYWLGATALQRRRDNGEQQQRQVLSSTGEEDDDELQACRTALAILKRSAGGRVSLPATHSVTKALVPTGHERCVLLQRICPTDSNKNGESDENNTLGWLIMSNQLLARFTEQDLQWLGRLANYVELY